MKEKHLFKYTPIETALIILEKRTLRFTDPKKLFFNDPFDCNSNLIHQDTNLVEEFFPEIRDNIIKNTINKKSCLYEISIKYNQYYRNSGTTENADKHLKSLIKFNINNYLKSTLPKVNTIAKNLADYYISCFSEVNDNILMWSHYAKSHTGLVLKFKQINNNFFCASKKVCYSKYMPSFLDRNILINHLVGGEHLINIERIFHHLWYTKSIDWEYEKELRVIIPATQQKQKSLGYADYSFAKDDLSAIYLGCRINEERRSQIINIINTNFPNAEIYQMTVDKKEFKINKSLI